MSLVRPAPRTLRRQSGLTLIGLLFYALLVVAGVYIVMQVVPSYTEYQAVKRTIRTVASSNPSTVEDARRMFDRQRDADLTIRSISGNDLQVSKQNGRVLIEVKYEKVLPIAGPVALLIRYEARSE
ncbi:MAG: hypothetical protein RI988_3019 [Pseudomonadota bacterium]|jgi:Tfp pilus assembly protein PilE